MPPLPKDPKIRRRRNKASTAAKLDADAQPRAEIPELPDRGRRKWHPLTISWWQTIWSSPMAAEWLEADIPRLWLLADLWDQYWRRPTTSLAAEIRLQGQAFGLTPIDRRRLQWEVERAESETRKKRAASEAPPTPRKDPRAGLRVLEGGKR